MDFDAFAASIRREALPVHGAALYADRRLCGTLGDVSRTRYPIYSATKSIVSLAAGIAWDDGRLDLDASVLCYLPAAFTAPLTPAQRETYRCITIRRLLSMSVQGYPFRPDGASWLREALALPLADPSERAFSYSNVSAYLVGVAVSCAVDEALEVFLARRLFSPLGIADPPFARCPDGFFYGASKMFLTVSELSRIGQLIYDRGLFDGKRLISKDYLRAACSVQQQNREGGYGFFLWKYRSGVRISGKWGQRCFILPEEGRLFTVLSDMQRGSARLTELAEQYLFD